MKCMILVFFLPFSEKQNTEILRQKKFLYHVLRNKMIQHMKIRCNFIKNRTQKCTLLFISHRSESIIHKKASD